VVGGEDRRHRDGLVDALEDAIQEIAVACDGIGAPKCARCDHAANGAAPVRDPLEALLAKSPAGRMAFWKAEFSRCTKCYACRQVCPLCYCKRCVADKNRPTVIDTSATLKGNFAWHITRAFHLAARCTGCGECARACPAGINLGLLNGSLARAADEEFGYRAGVDSNAPPLIGTFGTGDKEDFIR
jgi:Fe-S oxidoreductase